MLNKASFLHKASKFSDSIECAHKVLELDSNNEKAVEIIILNLSSQVELDNEKGNNIEALIKLERAIELKPNDTSLLFNKAAILHELEKYEEAIECIDKLMESEETFSNAKLLKAAILHKQSLLEGDDENYVEALSKIDQAILLKPNEIIFLINKSSFLFKLKQYVKAAEFADMALALDKTNKDAMTIKNYATKHLINFIVTYGNRILSRGEHGDGWRREE